MALLPPSTIRRSLRAALLAGTMLSAPAAFAQKLPQGGQVVGGAATISQPSANQMVVNQSTQRTAINWQSFNIGAGNGVQFVQPSSSAIALNRVVGMSGASQILGTLTANGQVFIVNPQGVVFGKGAVVNTGALLATTRDIDPTAFMQGSDKITLSGGSKGTGVVRNAGQITTQPGGYVVLAGDRVSNKGTINTPGGTTVLAAGDQATVSLSNGQMVNVTLNAAVANATVRNGGVIQAAGGKVVLSANGAGTVLGGAINLTGTVDVSAALAGSITVNAGPTGTVNATGAKLNAVSTAGQGGTVTLTGRNVGLLNGTKVNASGTTGGGTVLVGGGAHGTSATVANAEVTVLDSTSSIDVSATQNGNGGTVVLWSGKYTGFYGTIAANGGSQGGDGGWVETSSAENLQALGNVHASAVAGKGGSWLLDPTDVTICTTTANATDTGGNWTVRNNTATISAAAITADLNNGTSVTITTTSNASRGGNITIASDIAKTTGANASLTLTANGTITDSGVNISSTAGALNLTMKANGTVTLADGSAFFLNGGTLNITGGNATNTQVGVSIGQTTINASTATISGTTNTAAYAVNLFGPLNASLTSTRLTINGTGGSNASVNFAALATVYDLTVNGNAKANGTGVAVGACISATGNVTLGGMSPGSGNGVGVNVSSDVTSANGSIVLNGSGNGGIGVAVPGTASASRSITIIGSSNTAPGVNITGALNASAGNLTVNGSSGSSRGARLAGTIAASGTVTINGSSNTSTGVYVPGNLTLAAGAGATIIGTSANDNGVLLAGTLDARNTPSLTINGTSTAADGQYYGVCLSGSATVADLTVNGIGNLSAAGDVGGTSLSGNLNASGNVTLNGQSNGTFSGIYDTGSIVVGGSIVLNGTGNARYGVNASGTLNASGTVTINGSSNSAQGVRLATNLTLAAGRGATINGRADADSGVILLGSLDSSATPLLTINGTSNANDGGYYGVVLNGTSTVANLTVNGIGNLSATGNVGGTIFSGTVNASGAVVLNGQSNGRYSGVLSRGDVVAASSVLINGTANASYGVNASGTLAASGTVTINGTSNSAQGLRLATNLTLAAAGGATIIGSTNADSGVVLIGSLDSSATPLLTINGSSNADDGGYYGVVLNGTSTVANLTVNGLGNLSAPGDVGGVTISGTLNASGAVVLNGRSNGTFSGVYFTGNIASAASVQMNGTGNAKYGVNASGTVASTGTVTINGTSNGTTGVLLNTSLTLAAGGGGTIIGRSNSTNGVFFAGALDSSGTPLLTINGTSAAPGGQYYGVAFTGNATTAKLAINGTGNLSATGNVGGTTFNGTLNASGDVTLDGRSNGAFSALYFSGNITSGGNVTMNGTANALYGVNLSGTVNAAGSTTISGSSNGAAGVLVDGNLTLAGSRGATIAGITDAGDYAVVLTANGTLAAAGPLTVDGRASGLRLDESRRVGGIEAAGRVNAGGNVTLNANVITLANASFGGNTAHVVLQALNTAAAFLVNGTGASFGNVASVLIGGTNQAANLDLAAPLTYAGAGNLSIVAGAANIALNGNIDASAGTGSVILSAGNGVPLNASQTNGNVTGGDVVVGAATGIAAGAGGTVVIYSGNANSSSFAALVTNGATSQNKDYATLANGGDVNHAAALNLFYRVVPTLAVTLGNATGASVTKTYDGVGVTPGYGFTGLIDGDSASSLTMTGGGFSSSLPLSAGRALHAGTYTISQGTATFSASYNYAVSVTNGTIVINQAPLSVTATSATKSYDGTTSTTALSTVSGAIAGDTFTAASLAEVYASSAALGINNSVLLPAGPLTNASFATSAAGSWISDYAITYTAALGTILSPPPTPAPTPAPSGPGTTTTTTPAVTAASFAPTSASVSPTTTANPTDGLASSAVLSLGSWLNSGGSQQNMPAAIALNEDLMHLLFTQTSGGQPLIQASWAFFNPNVSGTINLPVNLANPAP